MAVCPAGDEIIGQFLEDRKGYRDAVVTPLQERTESVYVIPDSDGEAHLERRFPHKRARRAGTGIRPSSVKSFFDALPLAFNRHRAEGLDATYHFTFTGEESCETTVVIREKRLSVTAGHTGEADLRLTADSGAWLRFLTGELGLLPALLRRKIRIKGSPALMKKFAACFPM
jgi:putative sterol carrier protein